MEVATAMMHAFPPPLLAIVLLPVHFFLPVAMVEFMMLQPALALFGKTIPSQQEIPAQVLGWMKLLLYPKGRIVEDEIFHLKGNRESSRSNCSRT